METKAVRSFRRGRREAQRLELEQELQRLPRSRLLLECGPYAVFVSAAVAIPRILRELGRLRGEAFPEVFEPGEVDLDAFDSRYLHLFVWHRGEREIVGGYRLGCTDILGARTDPRRLYTNGLFEFGPKLVRALDPAIELGRSFVTPPYQRSYSALNLLWRGIGAFLARQPRYRYLFGALTIPHDLPPLARDYCLAFLDELGTPTQWAGLVRGTVPFEREALPGASSLSELERQLALVSESGVPPLLRHYVRLGARSCAFSADPAFAGSVDAFIVVDLAAAPPALLERFLGPEATRVLAGPKVARPASA